MIELAEELAFTSEDDEEAGAEEAATHDTPATMIKAHTAGAKQRARRERQAGELARGMQLLDIHGSTTKLETVRILCKALDEGAWGGKKLSTEDKDIVFKAIHAGNRMHKEQRRKRSPPWGWQLESKAARLGAISEKQAKYAARLTEVGRVIIDTVHERYGLVDPKEAKINRDQADRYKIPVQLFQEMRATPTKPFEEEKVWGELRKLQQQQNELFEAHGEALDEDFLIIPAIDLRNQIQKATPSATSGPPTIDLREKIRGKASHGGEKAIRRQQAAEHEKRAEGEG